MPSTPGYRTDTNTAFGEDVLRGYKQTAFFASADFDIIPKVLTVTAGTRHYHYDEFEHGPGVLQCDLHGAERPEWRLHAVVASA